MSKAIKSLRPRRKPIQGRSRETVGYILEAAAQLFGAMGYARTTTNHIAERAGVSVGSVYQYFPNKDALLLALAEDHLKGATEELTTALRGLRQGEPSLELFVRGFVWAVVDFHRREEPLQRILYEEAPRTPGLRELLGALEASLTMEVEGCLLQLGLGGADPILKSTVLVSMVGMLVHEVVLDPPAGQTPAACAEEVVTACSSYLSCPSNTSMAEAPRR